MVGCAHILAIASNLPSMTLICSGAASRVRADLIRHLMSLDCSRGGSADSGAQVVIAGGMGRRARDAFDSHGIQVVVGAPPEEPHAIVQAYLDGKLTIDDNPCDH